MLELRPALKAIKGLAIPSVSISIFLLFIVADLELVWNIISGSTYFSYVIRLVMLGVEIYLFRYFYIIELKKLEKERRLYADKQLKDSLEDINKITSLVTLTKVDWLSNYIEELRGYNKFNVDFIEDSNRTKWYRFTVVK